MKDGSLGAEPSAAGGYGDFGGKALSRWAIYGKKVISMPLDHILHVF